jgi:hypothetical protein
MYLSRGYVIGRVQERKTAAVNQGWRVYLLLEESGEAGLPNLRDVCYGKKYFLQEIPNTSEGSP